MRGKSKRNDGSITVEAVIVLPIFIFVFLTFFCVLRIAFIELKVQEALTNAAREISRYSYVYAFSGLKDKADDLNKDSENTKADINDNVINNFSTIMDSIGNTKNNVEASVSSVSIDGNLDEALKSLAEAKTEAENGVNAGKQIVSYLKTNLGNAEARKTFLLSLVKVLASDGLEIVKGYLGEVLAETFCEPYFTTQSEQALFKSISFDKSSLFPGTSGDIVLVAEYNVKVIPYLPLDIKYTISQQAVTTGWLAGDGKKINKNGFVVGRGTIKNANVWNEPNNVEKRAKDMRTDKLSELEKDGYRKLYDITTVHAYNPDTNTMAYIGTSNPLYLDKTVDSLDDDAIKDNYIDMIVKLDTNCPSEIRYKLPGASKGSMNVITKRPEEKPNKKIYLIIPEDKDLEGKMLEIWNNIPEQDKRGVELDISKGYGSVYLGNEE